MDIINMIDVNHLGNLFVNKIRYLFYMVDPRETMYPSLDRVPRYVIEMFPFFILMGFLENSIRLLQGKNIMRLNDNVASLSQGIFQECLRIKIRSIEIIVYCFVFENFRITCLPYDSLWTWYICLLAIDLGFYWAHRIAHEVNFIWAIHQAHHSPEDFTMTSALRQAVLQPFTAWLTYIPLALFLPPPIFLAHLQLGELFMFWLHTEIITKLGPLEYVINTPSHHRVHHGRNPKYIDKNYAGVFIFWDFLFGTFIEEDLNDPPIYGLVHPVQSYNPFYVQFHHWGNIIKGVYNTPGWKDKLKVIFYGPGWTPGAPRLGYYEMIPEVDPNEKKYDPPMNLVGKIYVIWHFSIILAFYHELTLRHSVIGQFTVTCSIFALLMSLTTIGLLLEGRWFAPILELSRCVIFFAAEQYLMPIDQPFELFGFYRSYIVLAIRLSFLISAIGNTIFSMHKLSVLMVKRNSMKKQC